MELKFSFVFLLILCFTVNASISGDIHTSQESKRKNFIFMLKCVGEEDPWYCGREIASVVLDKMEIAIEQQRKLWEDEADTQILTTGRTVTKMPSEIGRDIMKYHHTFVNILGRLIVRALIQRNKHDDTEMGRKFNQNTQLWNSGEVSIPEVENSISGRRFLPENESSVVEGRGLIMGMLRSMLDSFQSLFGSGFRRRQNQVPAVADGLGGFTRQRISIEDLLVVGAVIKGNIAILLQLINLHMQVKFFTVFLASFAVEVARLYLEYTRMPMPVSSPLHKITSQTVPITTIQLSSATTAAPVHAYIVNSRNKLSSPAPVSSTEDY